MEFYDPSAGEVLLPHPATLLRGYSVWTAWWMRFSPFPALAPCNRLEKYPTGAVNVKHLEASRVSAMFAQFKPISYDGLIPSTADASESTSVSAATASIPASSSGSSSSTDIPAFASPLSSEVIASAPEPAFSVPVIAPVSAPSLLAAVEPFSYSSFVGTESSSNFAASGFTAEASVTDFPSTTETAEVEETASGNDDDMPNFGAFKTTEEVADYSLGSSTFPSSTEESTAPIASEELEALFFLPGDARGEARSPTP
jgi:hypothetical protein